jgi:hypothetical protein
MTTVQAVAAAFGLPEADVAAWAPRTVRIFHRVAIARGWLLTTTTGETDD